MKSISTVSGNDAVMTAPWLAEQCMQWAGVRPGERFYEPCCGSDNFVRAIHSACEQFDAPPIIEWAEITRGRNMFDYDPGQVDTVITNPPYSLLKDFIPHMLNVVRPGRMILLAPLTNVVTKKRLRDTFDAGYSFSRIHRVMRLPPPSEWPASGFQQCFIEYRHGSHATIWS